MKIQFMEQSYQVECVSSVVDCFLGQPKAEATVLAGPLWMPEGEQSIESRLGENAIKNAELSLTNTEVLSNINDVQRRQGIDPSISLEEIGIDQVRSVQNTARRNEMLEYRETILSASSVHLDIEMETGTGKTYCYIRTMFELNKLYGWSKYIVMVPSIAIREGVLKAFEITEQHFSEIYNKKVESFAYNSRSLSSLKSFVSDERMSVMIINMQAFNASGNDRRIYEKLEEFQSKRPIDEIARCKPIIVLDEPQRMTGKATSRSLPDFNPLFMLRYSATHSKRHHLVYRLDAVDAYRRKLVKRISVRGIRTEGLTGANCYIFFESIELSAKGPRAKVEIEVKQKSGKLIRKQVILNVDDNLYELSGRLEQYKGYDALQIDAKHGYIEFKNGKIVKLGDAVGDTSEIDVRRIQIREAIDAHFEKESRLFYMGIKVLTLFFIDEVVKYRNYTNNEGNGEYANIFEEEYKKAVERYTSIKNNNDDKYETYLRGILARETHCGYFSIDRRSGKEKETERDRRGEESTDADAFSLIMKEKERLLSIDEPIRFIFSHSALREGWDNTNVFTICMLKSRSSNQLWRQEVGRGLRLCVNSMGERQSSIDVTNINELTVVANDSYENVVSNLQKDIMKNDARYSVGISVERLEGLSIEMNGKYTSLDVRLARKIYGWLLSNEYVEVDDQVSEVYFKARVTGEFARLPDELVGTQNEVIRLVDELSGLAESAKISDGRKQYKMEPNRNFESKEFKRIWAAIKYKAIWRMEVDEGELISRCVASLNSCLDVKNTTHYVETGDQVLQAQVDKVTFKRSGVRTHLARSSRSLIKYDLIGRIATESKMSRKTVAEILSRIDTRVFNQYRQSPEQFIHIAFRILDEVRSVLAVKGISYTKINQMYEEGIFWPDQTFRDLSDSTNKLKKHIYDYIVTDSRVEEKFAKDLDCSREVVVFAKLPSQYKIPTPFGNYVPDWAIVFDEGSVKHVYFIAETKGSLSTLNLRGVEVYKIQCARQFFQQLREDASDCKIEYDVVSSFEDLMEKANRSKS